jgi:hypothetical protein
MKRIWEDVSIAVLVLLTVAPAGGGDTAVAMVAKIPFEFTVGDQAYPAGSYFAGLPSQWNPAVLGFGGQFERMNDRFLTFTAPAKIGNPSLDFRLYRHMDQNGTEQSSYFLYRVNLGFGEMGRELLKSKTERAVERETRQHPLRSASGGPQSWQPEIVSVAAASR